jgi:putative colanic acid biosynthesis glycosyltransferase
MRKVLQVNIRLSEGGAAGVARTLADELRRLDIDSPFAYGYGKGGGPSPLETEYSGVRVTPRPIAALNRLSYAVLGKETDLASPKLWSRLRSEIRTSDVIHLHAIHSYFASTEMLFDALIAAGKPVVWTLHDQWIMTGRCAQPGTCRRWETGCKACPDLAAYPPAVMDHAAQRWPQRNRAVRKLQENLPTAIVACADWLGDEAHKAGLQNVRVIKNSVDRAFWEATTDRPSIATNTVKNLFMCRDLRDKLKVDWSLLGSISQIKGQSLTVIGDNAEELPPNVAHHEAIMDRRRLGEIMASHTRLIFTSRVDYFPLTIAEALTAGLDVLALNSQAAREFSSHPRVRIASDEGELLAMAKDTPSPTNQTVSQRAFFDPQRMTQQYLDLYKSLVS